MLLNTELIRKDAQKIFDLQFHELLILILVNISNHDLGCPVGRWPVR